MTENVGGLREALGERVARRLQGIDKDLEAIARQIGDPTFKITPRRAIAEERRRKSNANACRAGRSTAWRLEPLGRARRDHRVRKARIFILQSAVVLALIGKEKIGPAQLVDGPFSRKCLRSSRELIEQRIEACTVTRTRRGDRLSRRRYLRQGQMTCNRGAQQTRISRERCAECAMRGIEIIAFGKRPAEEIQRVRIARIQLRRLAI